MNTHTQHCSKWFDIRNPWRKADEIGILVRYELQLARDAHGLEIPVGWELLHAEWNRRDLERHAGSESDYECPDTDSDWSILEPILADELQELHGITSDGAPVYDSAGARLIPFHDTLKALP